jgi:nucleotide-binding universal stress UspA family protein
MGEQSNGSSDGHKTPQQLAAEIAVQREQLAHTIDELAEKLDVKSQARRKVADLKASATTDAGKPRPEVLAAAGSLVAMAVVLLLWRRRRDH